MEQFADLEYNLVEENYDEVIVFSYVKGLADHRKELSKLVINQ